MSRSAGNAPRVRPRMGSGESAIRRANRNPWERLVPVLHEDDHLLIVVKPAGVDAGGLDEQTWEGLVEILPRVRDRKEPLVAANRLSRYESGVLILAKTESAANAIRAEFRSSRVAQEYVGVVLGRMSAPLMTIGSEHGRSQGRRAVGKQAVAKRTAARGGARIDSPARSATVASRFGRSVIGGASGGASTLHAIMAGERRTLLRIATSVPTTHALRAQLRSVRLRLLGDLIANPTQRPMRHSMTCLHLSRVTFQHPATRRPLSVSCPPPLSFADVAKGQPDPFRPLHAALVRRLPCLLSTETDCFRLLSGDAEDVRGIVAEKFGDVVVLQVLRDGAASSTFLKQSAKWYRDAVGAKSVYAKRVPRPQSEPDRPSRLERAIDADRPTLLLGPAAPYEFAIRENGLRFLVRPTEPAVGLFLDQRDNRFRIRELAQGKDVLNLFAYTCGFSVAAAAGGARSTISVDLSPQPLAWGRANFELNSIELGTHEFLQSEAFEFLHRARDQGRRFDIVILDPPTFAHGRRKQRDFSVRRDLGGLALAVAEVLRAGGLMLVSTNLRSFTLPAIRNELRRCVSARRFEVLEIPRLPPDFAVDADHSKSLLLRFP